jgi:O-antigen/teichoic acid export membrane protein
MSPPSQPANYTRNVVSTYVNAIVLAVVALVVTPVLTHHLGVVRFGVWALIGSLIPYFELLELGFANSTITYVARHRESGGNDVIHRTLNTSFFVLMVPGFLAAGAAVIVAVFLPDIVTSIPHDVINQARILLLLLAFDMAVSIPGDTFGGALIAIQRYDVVNTTLAIVTVLQAVAWVIVLELHGGLIALGIVTVALSLCGQLSRFLLLRRFLPQLSVSYRAFDRSILRSFLSQTGWFSLGEVATAVVSGVDVIIVGIVVGVRAAAIFTLGYRLASLPARAVTPPADVVFPYAGQLAGRGDREGMRAITQTVTRRVMSIALPGAGAIMLLAFPAVRAWVGPNFHKSAEVAIILAAAVIFTALTVTPRAVVSGSGEPKVPTLVLSAEAVLHVGLAIALCHFFGLLGAAEAALISTVLMEAIVLLPMLYRKLQMGLRAQLAWLLRAHLPPVVVAGSIGWLLGRGPDADFVKHHERAASISVLVGSGLAVVVAYYGVLWFTGTDPEQRSRVRGWVRRRLLGGSRSERRVRRESMDSVRSHG